MKLVEITIFLVICQGSAGQERRVVDGAKHAACTVEMASVSRRVDAAVVDEIQMIADPSRGHSFTRAILGIPAQTLHVCGDPAALPLLQQLVEDTGETRGQFLADFPCSVREASFQICYGLCFAQLQTCGKSMHRFEERNSLQFSVCSMSEKQSPSHTAANERPVTNDQPGKWMPWL